MTKAISATVAIGAFLFAAIQVSFPAHANSCDEAYSVVSGCFDTCQGDNCSTCQKVFQAALKLCPLAVIDKVNISHKNRVTRADLKDPGFLAVMKKKVVGDAQWEKFKASSATLIKGSTPASSQQSLTHGLPPNPCRGSKCEGNVVRNNNLDRFDLGPVPASHGKASAKSATSTGTKKDVGSQTSGGSTTSQPVPSGGIGASVAPPKYNIK